MEGFQKVIANVFEEKGLGEDVYRHWFHIVGRVRSNDLVTFFEIANESTKHELLIFTENLKRNLDFVLSSEKQIELCLIVRHEKLLNRGVKMAK